MAKILMANIERPGYGGTLDEYRQAGGYKTLEQFLCQKKPGDMIEEVKKSGLRGRGGAGFPTGLKWSFLPKGVDKPVYLVCNADESEPGTFKDRVIMEKDPHMLLEGIVLSAFAINSHVCYIYIRGEFAHVAKALEQALAEARAANLVGKNILGRGFDVDIWVHRGAGAYVCGEETGLLESLEGKRGWPRLKPPFPAIEGAFKCPTIVNNVETLANVPWILENGGDAYAGIGVEKGAGTKIYCVSGHVKKPGLYEFPLGMTLRELIFDHCGGMRSDKALKAVIPGGSSMPVLRADEIDVQMDFDSLQKIGSGLGSAGVIVMDESVCMVNAALNLSKFYAHESCGQCTPCREGMPWLRDMFDRIEHGRGKEGDIETILDVTDNIEGKTICPLGEAGAWPARAFTKKFREEFEQHIREQRCPMRPASGATD
jgi:NADH-quinone oxidoreductase subunit F